MKYYTYIIYSEYVDQYYIGQTQNLENRLHFHNTGRSKFTKSKGPWILIAYKGCVTRKEAMAWERKLKNLKSRHLLFEAIDKYKFVRL